MKRKWQEKRGYILEVCFEELGRGWMKDKGDFLNVFLTPLVLNQIRKCKTPPRITVDNYRNTAGRSQKHSIWARYSEFTWRLDVIYIYALFNTLIINTYCMSSLLYHALMHSFLCTIFLRSTWYAIQQISYQITVMTNKKLAGSILGNCLVILQAQN